MFRAYTVDVVVPLRCTVPGSAPQKNQLLGPNLEPSSEYGKALLEMIFFSRIGFALTDDNFVLDQCPAFEVFARFCDVDVEVRIINQ